MSEKARKKAEENGQKSGKGSQIISRIVNYMTMATEYEIGMKNVDEEQERATITQHVTVTADGLYDAFQLAKEHHVGWEPYQALNTDSGVTYHLK